MKNMREELDIITAYESVGTYRGAAEVCGTTHNTVKRVEPPWVAWRFPTLETRME